MEEQAIIKRIRLILCVFIICLFLSGLTAIPVKQELNWVLNILPSDSIISLLLSRVLNAYTEMQSKYNFLLYGYDWLAFAHFILAILFIGPYNKPVQNIWVIEFGLIACVLVIPFALIAGFLRGLPLWWRLGDCSFGVVGFIVLWRCHLHIKKLTVLYTVSSKPQTIAL